MQSLSFWFSKVQEIKKTLLVILGNLIGRQKNDNLQTQ